MGEKVRVKIKKIKYIHSSPDFRRENNNFFAFSMDSFAMKTELSSEKCVLGKMMALKEEVKKKEEEMETEIRKMHGEVAGMPKPSFFVNFVTNQSQPKCPALKKKRKQALHFPKFAVSKRRLHMEEEEVDRMGLKKLKEDHLEEEMEQLDILITNMLSSNTK